MTTAYISGPITNDPDYLSRFADAHSKLDALGYRVIDPTRQPAGMEWREYMRRSHRDVEDADIVVLLDGWESSRGARMEQEWAMWSGRPAVRLSALLGLAATRVGDDRSDDIESYRDRARKVAAHPRPERTCAWGGGKRAARPHATDGMLAPDDERHGTSAGYAAGCRCEACRAGMRAYRRWYDTVTR